MKNNRNERINQVHENTLVIGIDIAKEQHYACAVDIRGRELAKVWRINQSTDGFIHFTRSIQKLMDKHQKTDVLIGFEATGHYWKNLAFYLESSDLPYVLVNPLHVKQSKEMDDNLQTKNDAKDARVIAKLLPNGYFSVPRNMTTIDHHLRQGSAIRERLRKDISAVKNRIQRWIDLYFPEFRQVFKHYGKQERTVLKLTPLPMDIKDASVEELVSQQKTAGAKYAGKPKMKKLIDLAQRSIGITDGAYMARIEIQGLVNQLELLELQLEEVTAEMIEKAKSLPEFQFLVSIKGISENTVSELLAETGSLQNYNHPRQIIKLAGFTLRENSSGKHQGAKRISKRGRRRLRALLYKAILPLIQNNTAFHKVYTYYYSREDNPLTKKEAMVVLCRKLIQVLHGLSTRQTMFDPERMLEDLSYITSSKAA
ncbi:IS110 family transposase [Halalkalibacter akibai]|uniref:Mobile element protein n=1 Tax=Halalkalibacter akibai (strain ATCC 43226 / DSM 21942 / CIP 109018 / JCM 9157 / 1139) TaxID=1236973 RepID=W4R2D1_HALA3|nr:IS110 family transposase [Halalkalibacter akibai]GAE37709.1 mobile element protein [Halalkalibacter akibai JCM 9157]